MLKIICNTSIFVGIVFVFLAVVVLATATLDMQAQLTWVAPKALLGGSPALSVISMYIVIVVRIAFCCVCCKLCRCKCICPRAHFVLFENLLHAVCLARKFLLLLLSLFTFYTISCTL